MPKQLALFICVSFILWLLVRDQKLRPMASWWLWVVFLWILIIGSRPVSFWFGGGLTVVTPGDYLEGSPLDRNVYLLLIVGGLIGLSRHKTDWNEILASNRWVFFYFFYCGVSVLWSEYSFVSFKRWIKDIGNLVMVLIILTEKDPVKATKAVFARFTYFVIPLSILFIKYFPEYGRCYNRWTWEPVNIGVTTEKNALGCTVFICGLFLTWELIEMLKARDKKADKMDFLSLIILLLIVCWLIVKADSMTSLVSLIIGVSILLFMRRPLFKRQIRYLGTYSLSVVFLILLLNFVPFTSESIVSILGRDMTLTGRTYLWADLLKEPVDPFIGEGYQGFWLGPMLERYWEKYAFHPNQAHNGYIETYLNGGLIGLFLLLTMIVSGGNKLKKEVLLGDSYGLLRFSFLVVNVFYNWTEAMFNRLSPVWIILLIATLNYSRPFKPMYRNIPK